MSFAGEMDFRSYCTEYEYTFRWTIDAFSKLPDYWMEKSPEFVVEPQSKWHIELKNEIGLYLYIFWNSAKRLRNSINISISNSDNEELFRNVLTYVNSKTDMIEDFKYKTFNLPNDQLVITISIKVWFIQSATIQPSKAPVVHQDPLRNLQSDLKKIFTDQIRPDFTFRIQGETLSAHKSFLTARSEVFAKMFQSGLKETETDTVDIKDVSFDAMRVLLQFMYSAEVDDLNLDTALDVYAAADKYAVLDLKDICSNVIASKVTIDTATDVLIFAKQHEDPILVDSIMQYIALHYGSKCQPSK